MKWFFFVSRKEILVSDSPWKKILVFTIEIYILLRITRPSLPTNSIEVSARCCDGILFSPPKKCKNIQTFEPVRWGRKDLQILPTFPAPDVSCCTSTCTNSITRMFLLLFRAAGCVDSSIERGVNPTPQRMLRTECWLLSVRKNPSRENETHSVKSREQEK